MSTLTYNGVVLDTIQTTAFTQEAVYDGSHTDYLYTKVMIAVKAVINPANAPGVLGETPAQTITRIRGCLLTQCGELIYQVGPDILVRSPNPGSPEDPKHGPFPLRCNIVSITEATFLIEFAVETYIVECCSGATLPYLSNRWEESHNINQDGYTRRTVKGRVVFRADQITSGKFDNGQHPDDYRGLISPPYLRLQPDFARESMDFVVQQDGLALEYTVVDQERYVQPPAGCTRFEGTHTVTSNKGAVFTQAITVKAWGDAVTPKAALINSAASIVLGRLNLSSNTLIKAGYVQDQIHENAVELRVETFAGPVQSTFFGLNVAKSATIGKLDYLFGDRRSKQQYDPGVRGTANLAMIAFDKYLSLCSNSPPGLGDVDLRAGGGPRPGSTPQANDTSLTSATVAVLPTQVTAFNPAETTAGVYTHYEIDTDYTLDTHTLQLPYMDTSLTACAIIPAGQPTQTKTVRYRVERWGAVPTLPSNLTTNPNNVLKWARTSPMAVGVAPDGITPIYTVTGEYLFLVIDPTLEPVLAGTPPYLNLNYLQTASGNYVNGLTDPPGSAELRGGPDIGF